MTDKLKRAIALIRSGDKRAGGRLLSEELLDNPQNELAWLWLSGVVANNEQRAYCLKKVLEINPGNQQALKGMKRSGHNLKIHPVRQVVSVTDNGTDSRERVKSKAEGARRHEIPRQCPNCGGNLDSALRELRGGLLDKLLECPYCGLTIDVPDQMIFSKGKDPVVLNFKQGPMSADGKAEWTEVTMIARGRKISLTKIVPVIMIVIFSVLVFIMVILPILFEILRR